MRFIQAAMTPIQFKDIYYALIQHINKRGLDEFKDTINSYLGLNSSYSSYTFTSFMRAIYACLEALKRVDNRKGVILPRYCCQDFTHAALASGLKIKYCDINPLTLSLDVRLLHEMNFEDVLALICVNHFGFANPMDEIVNLCKRNKIYLIEDLGYALGTEFKNRKLGNFGDFAVLNFREGKGIPVGGGMLITRYASIMDHLNRIHREKERANIPIMLGYKLLSNQHIYYLLIKVSKLLRYDIQASFSMEDTDRNTTDECSYQFSPDKPLKSISNFQGGLGLAILSKIDKYMELRRERASVLETELSQLEHINIIQKEPGCGKIHHIRYPILVEETIREHILTELLRHGIGASPMYTKVKPDGIRFPQSARVSREILTLPCHPRVKQEDLETIISVIRNSTRPKGTCHGEE